MLFFFSFKIIGDIETSKPLVIRIDSFSITKEIENESLIIWKLILISQN